MRVPASILPSLSARLADLSELFKARLTLLVLVTTGVGYYCGTRGSFQLPGFFHVLFGTALAAAGASALNQWWEYDLDARMVRTRERPVPGGRMRPQLALWLGAFCSLLGVAYLASTTNVLSAVLGGLTILIYVLGYTPLKRLATTNTLVGAIPGALPPVIGWTAARGYLDFGAWTLFIILFFWQMPHFFAIAWLYRQDYASAGFRMLSDNDEDGRRCASQAVLFCVVLLLVAGIPAFIGMVHPLYLVAELLLGGIFTFKAMQFHRAATTQSARGLFFASILYLPLLLAALMLAK